jgi:hypothetical protein
MEVKACKASTHAFHGRTVTDTFTATVTAPPGMRIARVHYEQVGTRFLERSIYWAASGTGTLTVNELTLRSNVAARVQGTGMTAGAQACLFA